MRAYFSQFGEITRLRLSRNRITGRSKHYAFIEFASATVAKIVAETMDNYLMYGHILKCKFVPSEQLHPDIWKGANRRFKKTPWNKIEKKRLERGKTRDKWAKSIQLEQKRRNLKAEKLKQLMDYEFEAPAIKSVDQVSAVREDSTKGSTDETPAPSTATNGVQPETETQPEPQPEPEPEAQPEVQAQPEEPATNPTAEKPADTPKQPSKKSRGKKAKSDEPEPQPQPEEAAERDPQPEPEPPTPATKTKTPVTPSKHTPKKSTRSRKTKSDPEPQPEPEPEAQSQPEPEAQQPQPEPEPAKPVDPVAEVPKQTPRKTRARKVQAEPEPEPQTPVASSPSGPPARRTRSSRKAKA